MPTITKTEYWLTVPRLTVPTTKQPHTKTVDNNAVDAMLRIRSGTIAVFSSSISRSPVGHSPLTAVDSSVTQINSIH